MSEELPDSPFEPVDSGGDMGGEEELSGGGGGSPMDRLFDGDAPGPQVGELKADYEMPQWMAVLSRGIMRVATGSGVPPIAEILIGMVMGVMGSEMNLGGVGGDSDDDRESSTANSDDGSTANGAPPGVQL